MRKYGDDKNKLKISLKNHVKKVKDLETKLQLVPATTFEEIEDSTKCKRDCTELYSSQEESLHKLLKQPRVLEYQLTYMFYDVNTIKGLIYMSISQHYIFSWCSYYDG